LVDPLNDVMPRFDVGEFHELRVEQPPAVAVDRFLSSPATPDFATRLLFAVRGLGHRRGTISELASTIGTEIRRREDQVVFLRSDGRIRIAIAVWAEGDDGGSILRTETRVRADDRRARLAFRAYWVFVGPFSAFIRRRWLRAAARA
jgi:hypothetical protein